ncbi:hypothetical protein ACQPT2_21805 [Erwinia amylovora]
MQLHEKRYIKRAGVAGIALRADIEMPLCDESKAKSATALNHVPIPEPRNIKLNKNL